MFVYQYMCLVLGVLWCWYVWRWPKDSNIISHAIYTLYMHVNGKLAKTIEILDLPEIYDHYTAKGSTATTYNKYLHAVTDYGEAARQKALDESKFILTHTCKAWLWVAMPCVVIAIGALHYLVLGFVCYFIVRLIKAYIEEIRHIYHYVSIVLIVDDCLLMYDEKQNQQA